MSLEAVSRFSVVFSIHLSARQEDASMQFSHAMDEAFKGIDYDTFLKLKRASKNHDMHLLIRKLFYSKFILDHFLHKSTISSGLPSIKAAFLNPVDILSLRFLHGSQMATVIAMLKGDRILKPGGVVRKANEFCINGEHNKGFSGVNRKGISGNVLEDAGHAFSYATHNLPDFNPKAIEFTRNPESGVVVLLSDIDRYAAQLVDKTKLDEFWNNYLGYDAPEHRVFNFQRLFLIVKALCRPLFESKVLPKLNELITFLLSLQDAYAKAIVVKMLEPILSFKLPEYSNAEIELIKADIPIIFGCKKVKIVEFKKRHVKKVAYPIFLSRCNEYVFRGSLKLVDDIQVIFTSRDQIEKVKKYCDAMSLNIPILDIDACLIASNYKRYKSRKLENR